MLKGFWWASCAAISSAMAFAATAQPWEKYKWELVTPLEAGSKRYALQIDRRSIPQTGKTVRYWVRATEIVDFEGSDFYLDKPAFGPSLYESDCIGRRWRLLQGNILYGYEGPTRPLSRPANWEYPAPDTVAMVLHKFACAAPK